MATEDADARKREIKGAGKKFSQHSRASKPAAQSRVGEDRSCSREDRLHRRRPAAPRSGTDACHARDWPRFSDAGDEDRGVQASLFRRALPGHVCRKTNWCKRNRSTARIIRPLCRNPAAGTISHNRQRSTCGLGGRAQPLTRYRRPDSRHPSPDAAGIVRPLQRGARPALSEPSRFVRQRRARGPASCFTSGLLGSRRPARHHRCDFRIRYRHTRCFQGNGDRTASRGSRHFA